MRRRQTMSPANEVRLPTPKNRFERKQTCPSVSFPRPCSVCGSPRLCRRRERRLIGARFGRWREERFGRARCLTLRYSLLLSVWVDPSDQKHTLPKRRGLDYIYVCIFIDRYGYRCRYITTLYPSPMPSPRSSKPCQNDDVWTMFIFTYVYL